MSNLKNHSNQMGTSKLKQGLENLINVSITEISEKIEIKQISPSELEIKLETWESIPMYIETSQLEAWSPEDFEIKYNLDIIDVIKNPEIYKTLKESKIKCWVIGHLELKHMVVWQNKLWFLSDFIEEIEPLSSEPFINKINAYEQIANILNQELKWDIYIWFNNNWLTIVPNGKLDLIIENWSYLEEELKVLNVNKTWYIWEIKQIIKNTKKTSDAQIEDLKNKI